jgi:hypothetical protein
MDNAIIFEFDGMAIMDNDKKFESDEISTDAVDPKKNAEKKKKKKRVVIHFTPTFKPVDEGDEKESPDSADQKLCEVSVSILYWTIVVRHICFVLINFGSYHFIGTCSARVVREYHEHVPPHPQSSSSGYRSGSQVESGS